MIYFLIVANIDCIKRVMEYNISMSLFVAFPKEIVEIVMLSISVSAILALKELSDCLDDTKKYRILRQIGADEKEINKALFKQTLLFFMLPLSLAIVHTIFGLKFCSFFLE